VRWPTVSLGEISRITAGNSAPQGQSDFSTDGTPFVRAGSLARLLEGSTGHLEKIAAEDAKRLKLRLFPKDTILFAKSGMSCMKGYVYRLPFEAHVVSHLAAVHAGARLHPPYAEHALRVFSPVALIKDESYPSIGLPQIGALEIPLPPFEEQKRIAAILDQADALRRLRARALDRLNGLGQAIFHEMFGDTSNRDASQNTEALGNLCELVRGSSPRPQGDPRYFGGPVPRLMIADITRDGEVVTPRIDSLTIEGATKSRAMKAGEVVMAVSGAVGLPAILAIDACIHDGFVGFRSLDPRLTPQFLYRFLVVERVSNQARGTGAIWSNLTTDQVKRFQIPLPPMEQQNEYLWKLTHIREIETTFEAAATEAEALFTSLQHRAFRGEL
jgi:type I restriction enzyme S subunit